MRSYRPDRFRKSVDSIPRQVSAAEFLAMTKKPVKRKRADPVKPVDLPPARLEGGRIRIALPMPPMRLSPNASNRMHGITKSKLTKRFRTLARAKMEQALAGESIILNRYSLAFFYEPKRRRDDDNFEGSVKAYRDGIADALGMNDRHLMKGALSTFAADRDLPRVEITLWHEQP